MRELEWLEELEAKEKKVDLGLPVPMHTEPYEKYQFKSEIHNIKQNIKEEIPLPESGEFYQNLHSKIMQQVHLAKKMKDQRIQLQLEKMNQTKEKYEQAKLSYSIGI